MFSIISNLLIVTDNEHLWSMTIPQYYIPFHEEYDETHRNHLRF